MEKARVGIVGVGHYIYFNQFPGLKEELVRKSVEFTAFIEEGKCEISDAGYADNVESAFEKVRFLKTQDVDLLFIIMSTYVPSAVVAQFARYIDAPQILVAIQPLNHLDYAHTTTYIQLKNDDVCAVPEATGVYRRLGRKIPPCIIASRSQEDYLRKEIGQWIDAANALAAFKYETIGYLGHTYEGMYDMHTDPTMFHRTFGAHVKMLEMCELCELADSASEAEIQAKIGEIKETFELCQHSHDEVTGDLEDGDLELSAKMAVALEKLVEKNHLRALCYFYKGENGNKYETYAANLIIGNTLLTSAGIPLAGEADLKNVAAMLIMNRIGGGGSFAEIHPFDTDSDIVLIGHDGPHNINIAEGKPKLRKLLRYHGKSGSGVGVEFSLKKGDITMLGLTLDESYQFRMVAAHGTSLPGEIPQTGNTNTKVSFGRPVHEFLRDWSEAGPTHHVALGTGNQLETLRKFSKLSGIPLDIIP